jgi:hypothetical protein
MLLEEPRKEALSQVLGVGRRASKAPRKDVERTPIDRAKFRQGCGRLSVPRLFGANHQALVRRRKHSRTM